MARIDANNSSGPNAQANRPLAGSSNREPLRPSQSRESSATFDDILGRSGPASSGTPAWTAAPDGSGPRDPQNDRDLGASVTDREDRTEDDRTVAAANTESPRAADTAPRPTSSSAQAKALETLIPKLVQSFRIGQNRAGNAEIWMDLKATTSGGLGIRMSQGPRGIQALLLVDQYAAKQALETQVTELTQRLEAQGLKIQEIRIEIESEHQARAQSRQSGGGTDDSGEKSGDPYEDPFADAADPVAGGTGKPSPLGPRAVPLSLHGPESEGRDPDRAGSPSRRSRTDYSL